MSVGASNLVLFTRYGVDIRAPIPVDQKCSGKWIQRHLESLTKL